MKPEWTAFGALRRTNPVRDNEVPGADSPEARELLTRILATPREQELRTPASRRKLRLVLAVAAISVITIAATWIWLRSISIPNAIICYQAVDLDADTAAAPPSETATGDACAPAWEQQTLVNPDIVPQDLCLSSWHASQKTEHWPYSRVTTPRSVAVSA